MANNPNAKDNLKPFKKGDPRINRNGRPKTFDGLRSLAQEIAHEVAQSGGSDAVIGGHKVTIAEAILRSWSMSKNPQLQRSFMEIAFGKTPDAVVIDSKIEQQEINHNILINAIRSIDDEPTEDQS